MFKVVINFKAYKEATGNNAVSLAKACKFNNVIVCAQASDINKVSKIIPTFAQHIDPVDEGAYTGAITAKSVKNAGARGTLLNHSEHRLPFEVLKLCVNLAKRYKLETIVCARTSREVAKVRGLNPNYIAIEPTELIGGKISVTQAKPGLLIDCLKSAGRIPLLCGAGVHSREDLETAKKSGLKGVLISSAVVKNETPRKKLMELLK
ncbi:triose-phosphate isomerase [archaeon]|nr:triose-phosphate isomerase [archaeon]